MNRRKNSPAKRILKGILLAVGVLIVLVGGLFGYLTVTEYYPEEGKREDLEINSPLEEEKAASADVREEEQAAENSPEKKAVRLVSWNIGYGALGDNADFFMDGGKGVKTADKARVEQNLQMVSEELKSLDPDVIFLQEIDRGSSRSYNIDETALLRKDFPQMWSSFANNFKVAFIPYPVPPIGKVDSGLLTLTQKLKKMHLLPMVNFSYKTMGHWLRNNLAGNNPWLFLFYIYKLMYFVHLKEKK